MVVTAHWIAWNSSNGSLEWKSALIAFRHVDGVHSGSHLAEIFFKILMEFKIIRKVFF
jgi:hypothetical protein